MIPPSLPLDEARRLLGDMIRVRVMEERCAELPGTYAAVADYVSARAVARA